jgi:hypothetical protein
VELDAIPPNQLRQLVGDAIAGHADARWVRLLKAQEYYEKEAIRSWSKLMDKDDDEPGYKN